MGEARLDAAGRGRRRPRLVRVSVSARCSLGRSFGCNTKAQMACGLRREREVKCVALRPSETTTAIIAITSDYCPSVRPGR